MLESGWLVPAMLGGAVLVIVAVLLFLLWRRSKEVDLTTTQPDETPEWMRSKPPQETLAATQADGEGMTLYDKDQGESLAAPFAEQIEDIVHDRISKDPTLGQYNVDFGTAPDGSLEIWVDDQRYADVADIPYPRLREIIREAAQSWQERP